MLDRQFPGFCFSDLTNPGDFAETLDKLGKLELFTHQELRQNGAHIVELKNIIRSARQRLGALQLDDCDNLWSIRFNGVQRVWAVQFGQVFCVLWCDKDHKICPSMPKNT